MDTGCTLDVG